MTLYHLTRETGHVARTERADVADDIIAMLRPLVAQERAQLPGPVPWSLLMQERHPGWACFSITAGPGGIEYVTCTGCWEASSSKQAWDTTSTHLRPPDDLPPPVPWLAVHLHANLQSFSGPPLQIGKLPPEAVSMLGDLERCIFWALAEGDRS